MLLISCRACDHEVPVDGSLETILCQKLGLADASESNLAQALRLAAQRLRCDECRSRSPEIVLTRDCALCGASIPRQRLDAMPDVTQCIDCQERTEANVGRDVEEELGRCPKCGSPLKTYQKRAGTTSYFVGCSAYPKCNYKPRT